MRYYLYIDRCFLRNLLSGENSSNFNIEVVEYSVRKSNTNNNQFSLDPCIENFCEVENEKQNAKDKDMIKRCKDSDFIKKRAGANYGASTISTIETQRRYINIEDITQIKNNCFYHNLIEQIKNKEKLESNRLVIEEGIISEDFSKLNLKEFGSDEKNGFFMLNNKLIWIYNDLLEGDIKLLSKMLCSVKVIGYKMNCSNTDVEVIKAIAIYIE